METVLPKKDLWHLQPWCLHAIPAADYTTPLSLLFNDAGFKRLFDHRVDVVNRMVAFQQSNVRMDAHRTAALQKDIAQNIVKADRQIADYLLQQLVHHQLSLNAKPIKTFEDFENDINNEAPELAEGVKRVAQLRMQIAFKLDSLENDIMNLASAVKRVDVNADFDTANAMTTALQMLRSFISMENSTRCAEERDLYSETADSIDAYFNKRISTYYNRIADMRNKAYRKEKQARDRRDRIAIAESEKKFGKKERAGFRKEVNRENYRLTTQEMQTYTQQCIDDLYTCLSNDRFSGTWKHNLLGMIRKDLGPDYCTDEPSIRQWLENHVQSCIMRQSKSFRALMLSLRSELSKSPA